MVVYKVCSAEQNNVCNKLSRYNVLLSKTKRIRKLDMNQIEFKRKKTELCAILIKME